MSAPSHLVPPRVCARDFVRSLLRDGDTRIEIPADLMDSQDEVDRIATECLALLGLAVTRTVTTTSDHVRPVRVIRMVAREVAQ